MGLVHSRVAVQPDLLRTNRLTTFRGHPTTTVAGLTRENVATCLEGVSCGVFIVAGERGGESEEGAEEVGVAFVADAQAVVAEQPGRWVGRAARCLLGRSFPAAEYDHTFDAFPTRPSRIRSRSA